MPENTNRDTEDPMKKLASPATAEGVGSMAAHSATSSAPSARPDRPQSKGIQVSDQAYPSVDLEGYLNARDRKGGKKVVRDGSGGIALVREDALNLDRFRENRSEERRVGKEWKARRWEGARQRVM